MYLTDASLNIIEQEAEKVMNVSLMFQVQILRELREVKELLKTHNESGNSGDNSSSGADYSKNEHG